MTMAEEDTCAVCDDPHSDAKNQIIYCDGQDCNMPLHQGCYGISRIPEGDWYCDRCKMARFNKRVNIICCTTQTGPVKRIGNTNEFMHVVCANFNKNIDSTTEPYIWKRSTQDTETCYICKKKFGLCILCDNFDCARYFHVTCGIRSGLITLGRPLSVSKPHFCNEHNPSLRMLSSSSSSSDAISSPKASLNIPTKRPHKPKQTIRQIAHLGNDSDSDRDDIPLSASHSWKTLNKKIKPSGSMDRSQKQHAPPRFVVGKPRISGDNPSIQSIGPSGSGPSRPPPSSSSIFLPSQPKPQQRQQQQAQLLSPQQQSLSFKSSSPKRTSPSSSPQSATSLAPSPPTSTLPLVAPTAPEMRQSDEELQREIRLLKQKLESEKKKNLHLSQEAKRTSELQKVVENMTSRLEQQNMELDEYRELKNKVTDIFMELNIGTTNGTYPSRDGIKHYIDILHETIRRTRMPTNDEWSEITMFATNLANARPTNINSSSRTSRPH